MPAAHMRQAAALVGGLAASVVLSIAGCADPPLRPPVAECLDALSGGRSSEAAQLAQEILASDPSSCPGHWCSLLAGVQQVAAGLDQLAQDAFWWAGWARDQSIWNPPGPNGCATAVDLPVLLGDRISATLNLFAGAEADAAFLERRGCYPCSVSIPIRFAPIQGVIDLDLRLGSVWGVKEARLLGAAAGLARAAAAWILSNDGSVDPAGVLGFLDRIQNLPGDPVGVARAVGNLFWTSPTLGLRLHDRSALSERSGRRAALTSLVDEIEPLFETTGIRGGYLDQANRGGTPSRSFLDGAVLSVLYRGRSPNGPLPLAIHFGCWNLRLRAPCLDLDPYPLRVTDLLFPRIEALSLLDRIRSGLAAPTGTTLFDLSDASPLLSLFGIDPFPHALGIDLGLLASSDASLRSLVPLWDYDGREASFLIEAEVPVGTDLSAPPPYLVAGDAGHFPTAPIDFRPGGCADGASGAAVEAPPPFVPPDGVAPRWGLALPGLVGTASFLPYAAWQDPSFGGILRVCPRALEPRCLDDPPAEGCACAAGEWRGGSNAEVGEAIALLLRALQRLPGSP